MELVLFSGSTSLLTCLVHVALYNLFFAQINIYGEKPYTFIGSPLCFFLTLALSLVGANAFPSCLHASLLWRR